MNGSQGLVKGVTQFPTLAAALGGPCIVEDPVEARNHRNRANRHCRCHAYHACRARSLVRLALVASNVAPPPHLRDQPMT
jgi:hypothetical protein